MDSKQDPGGAGGESAGAPLHPIHPDDLAALEGTEVIAAHRNESHWWNHASFVLPLLGAIVFLAIGQLAGSAEATGFGIFLAVVMVLQLPIVWFTWRRTATAIVLTHSGALALHRGRTLAEVRWAELERIERVETLGNVRWRLAERGGTHIAVEGEIEDVPGLVERASALSGVEPEGG
ncbi:MAG: hypothetical protein F4X76_08070 [Chloroflexi bacterium]|nr:hypothetical protein [Chloroflexota bacterium]